MRYTAYLTINGKEFEIILFGEPPKRSDQRLIVQTLLEQAGKEVKFLRANYEIRVLGFPQKYIMTYPIYLN